MSYTKLFQRNDTYGRCEFEYNISQADNRSFMLPTLWIMKMLRCRQAISQPFFFTLPRYEILFRVTPAPTTAKTHHTAEASIRSCSTTQQSTCIFVDVLCFIFDSKYVVLFGQRVQDCDDGAAMWRGCGYDPFPLQEKLKSALVFFRLIVGCFTKCFSHCNLCLFSWWIISEMPLVRGRCKGCRYVTNFLCWSHLELNRTSRFLDEHFVSCLSKFIFCFCLRSRSRLSIP